MYGKQLYCYPEVTSSVQKATVGSDINLLHFSLQEWRSGLANLPIHLMRVMEW